ncbi:Derlin 1 [Podila humilis]|nr:Derlin 1 [Podila humilis]
MPENELVAAYRSVPIVTRTLLTSTILISLGAAVKAISYSSVALHWPSIIYRFHIHRLFTPFFLTAVNFNMLFDLYFMFTYGSQLEKDTFAGRSADFAWYIIFTCLTSSVIAYYMDIAYLFQSLVIAVIYLWAQSNSDRIVSFMFGVTFKAFYFPFVLMAYSYVMSGASIPWPMVIGAVSAHLYYFLDTQYPAMGGPRLIPTPSILYKILPSQEVVGGGFNAGGGTTPTFRAPAGAAANTGGHQWGSGQRLG